MSLNARIARRPVLSCLLMTLALIVLLGVAGTALYLSGNSAISPVAVVFAPVAIALAIGISRARTFRAFGFRAPRPGWVLAALPAGLVLVMTAASVGIANELPWEKVWAVLGLVALVAFVEETLFRSLFIALLGRKRVVRAVLVSSTLFALAHAVNLLGGQDAATTVVQIVFAFAFGSFAAAYFLRTESIWPMIAFHGLFDAIGLLGARETPVAVDAASAVILLISAAVLLRRMTAERAAERAAEQAAERAAARAFAA